MSQHMEAWNTSEPVPMPWKPLHQSYLACRFISQHGGLATISIRDSHAQLALLLAVLLAVLKALCAFAEASVCKPMIVCRR